MIELFTDLSIIIKRELEKIINTTLDSLDIEAASKLIEEFAQQRPEAEQEFINFYFHLKKEQLKNEDNFN